MRQLWADGKLSPKTCNSTSANPHLDFSHKTKLDNQSRQMVCCKWGFSHSLLNFCHYCNINPYNFKFSYTWTSEGKTIQSYDVSENGQIAIAFSDNTIGVFDKNMNFMYQLSFLCSGASGVLWLGEQNGIRTVMYQRIIPPTSIRTIIPVISPFSHTSFKF